MEVRFKCVFCAKTFASIDVVARHEQDYHAKLLAKLLEEEERKAPWPTTERR